MLDEIVYRNASKFAIFLEVGNSNILFVFHFEQLQICINDCPGLCRLSTYTTYQCRASTLTNPKLLKMKNEKNYLWQILKRLARQFHQA